MHHRFLDRDKAGFIIPVLKSGGHSLAVSYRSISLSQIPREIRQRLVNSAFTSRRTIQFPETSIYCLQPTRLYQLLLSQTTVEGTWLFKVSLLTVPPRYNLNTGAGAR